jgi:hypothetical protein
VTWTARTVAGRTLATGDCYRCHRAAVAHNATPAGKADPATVQSERGVRLAYASTLPAGDQVE